MPEWITEIWRRMTHQYVRPGEWILIYKDREDGTTPTQYRAWSVGGWAVEVVQWRGEVIRRDLIRKDTYGNWYYRYDA